MNKLQKIKIIFIFLFLVLGFILLRFRSKPEFTFIFGPFEPIILLSFSFLFSIIFLKFPEILNSYLKNKKIKENLGFFSKIFKIFLEKCLNSYFLLFFYLQKFDNLIFLSFPKFYLTLCYFCNWFWQKEMILILSKKKKERFLGKLIRNIRFFPFYLSLLLDFFYQKWHFIFWGILFYFLIKILFRLRFYWSEKFYSFFSDEEDEEEE
jgi:hypothetical protein